MQKILIIFFLSLSFQCFSQSFEKSIDSIDFYINTKNFIKGLDLSEKRSKEYLSQKDYEKYCLIILKKSTIYFLLNEKEKSFQNLFQVLKITDEQNLLKIKIQTLEDIGHRYATILDYKKAIDYYHKSIALAKKNKITDQNSFVYQRIYAVYFESNSDSAFYYLEKVMKDTRKSGSDKKFADSYNNYFSYYNSRQQYDLAKKYLDSSLIFAKRSKNNYIISTALNNLGCHYMIVEKDYRKAINEFEKVIKLNSTDTLSSQIADIYLNLSYGYEMVGDYKNAHDYLNKWSTLNENIYQGNLKQAINDVETKYRIEKMESENREKERVFDEKQKNNHKIILIFVALFAFSTILFYFFYQNLRLKQKNKFIELDRQVKQNIINASIDGQEIERKNIANILHDSISALLSSAGLHLAAYMANNSNEDSAEIKKAKDILKEAHDNVRDLSHDLLPPLLAKFGLLHALQDLSEKNSNSVLQFEYMSYLKDGKRYPEEFEMRVYFIITELFNNIMKHSKASKAYTTIEETNNQLLITVEDDGKGFDTTKELSSDGFGLTQIKSRIKHLGGNITINSKINAGTLIYIKLQIPK
ncbi:ATP-binding protein [Flavobacterium qiangtangense]|uniref:Oxygen sensor histidine kinase NreB n=1 Tax=Flavobacterium qiangtangense TaxID=1442595 RepID=A0ABW1PHF9_9FLAO